MTFIPFPKNVIGGETKTDVYDVMLNATAKELLIQIKILNVYMSRVVGEELNETDID